MSLLPQALDLLGQTLERRRLSYDLVAIGGSGLLLLGLIWRPSQDLDIVALIEGGHMVRADPLPGALTQAAHDVASALGINADWLDPRPAAFMDSGLPPGFESRLEARAYGPLTVHLASRFDQIHFKVYAAADHLPASRHLDDLVVLAPTRDELIAASRWARTQDPSAGFRGELVTLLERLGLTDANDII